MYLVQVLQDSKEFLLSSLVHCQLNRLMFLQAIDNANYRPTLRVSQSDHHFVIERNSQQHS